MKLKHIATLFSIMIFFSCEKEYVVDVEPTYKGEWHSDPVTNSNGIQIEIYFIIDGKSGLLGEWCELMPLGGNCSSYFNGEVKFNRKQNKISIGPAKNQVILRVDVPPHLNTSGKWECTLTSRVYIKN